MDRTVYGAAPVLLFRYGVPWQYSGKEVQVRLHNGYVEIYQGEALLTRHEAKNGGSRILWLKGQYKGLSTCHGIPGPYPGAYMTQPKVEQRDLNFYDQLLGGASGTVKSYAQIRLQALAE